MMKIKFNDGTLKACAAPTEQKLFKTSNGSSVAAGWAVRFNVLENITSDEVDTLLTPENIESVEFLSDEGAVLFSLSGYTNVVSSTIRHSEATLTAYAEIQLSKGA